MKTELFPFADELTYRPNEERLHEEVYRTIPELNALATVALRVANALPSPARDALFLGDGTMDPGLRTAQVQAGMVKRHQQENAEPDLAYLAGIDVPRRQDFETKDNDPWLEP